MKILDLDLDFAFEITQDFGLNNFDPWLVVKIQSPTRASPPPLTNACFNTSQILQNIPWPMFSSTIKRKANKILQSQSFFLNHQNSLLTQEINRLTFRRGSKIKSGSLKVTRKTADKFWEISTFGRWNETTLTSSMMSPRQFYPCSRWYRTILCFSHLSFS